MWQWNFLASGNYFSHCVPFSVLTNDAVGRRDTVCSVGFIPRDLPFTASNTAVRYFRHALALDERRATFHVNHWHRRRKYNHDHEERPHTDVREVWFAGCHCGFVFRLYLYCRIDSDVVYTQTLGEVRSQMTRRTAWLESHCVGWSSSASVRELEFDFAKNPLRRLAWTRIQLNHSLVDNSSSNACALRCQHPKIPSRQLCTPRPRLQKNGRETGDVRMRTSRAPKLAKGRSTL